MTAAEARALKIGDYCGACFGSYRHKDCEIIAINWPTFTLRWKDSRGQWQTRDRTYRSIYKSKGKSPDILDPARLPAWLKYEVST